MTNANRLTIADARDALRAGDLTAVELTDACLSAIDASGALNAFVHHTPDMARDIGPSETRSQGEDREGARQGH